MITWPAVCCLRTNATVLMLLLHVIQSCLLIYSANGKRRRLTGTLIGCWKHWMCRHTRSLYWTGFLLHANQEDPHPRMHSQIRRTGEQDMEEELCWTKWGAALLKGGGAGLLCGSAATSLHADGGWGRGRRCIWFAFSSRHLKVWIMSCSCPQCQYINLNDVKKYCYKKQNYHEKNRKTLQTKSRWKIQGTLPVVWTSPEPGLKTSPGFPWCAFIQHSDPRSSCFALRCKLKRRSPFDEMNRTTSSAKTERTSPNGNSVWPPEEVTASNSQSVSLLLLTE